MSKAKPQTQATRPIPLAESKKNEWVRCVLVGAIIGVVCFQFVDETRISEMMLKIFKPDNVDEIRFRYFVSSVLFAFVLLVIFICRKISVRKKRTNELADSWWRDVFEPSSVWGNVWPRAFVFASIATCLRVLLYCQPVIRDWKDEILAGNAPWPIVTGIVTVFLGVGLGQQLNARTAAAHDRWYEARKLVGIIAHQARNIVIAGITYKGTADASLLASKTKVFLESVKDSLTDNPNGHECIRPVSRDCETVERSRCRIRLSAVFSPRS